MNRIILITIIALCADASAACAWTGNVAHAEYRACLEAASKGSFAKIEAAEAWLRKRIADSDDKSEFKKSSLTLLQESASAYRQYRSSQCNFEASTAAGGNGAGDLRLICQGELDKNYLVRLVGPHGVLTE
ncbi:MAG: lysozyme inhibitor LprI family protein [Burkholderiales bacterium]